MRDDDDDLLLGPSRKLQPAATDSAVPSELEERCPDMNGTLFASMDTVFLFALSFVCECVWTKKLACFSRPFMVCSDSTACSFTFSQHNKVPSK